MAQAEKRKRSIAHSLSCGGVILLLGAAFMGLVFTCLEVPVQPQRQSDGSTLSLLGYTTPDRPELMTGPSLFRLLTPLLSDSQERYFNVRRLRHPGGALTLWVRHTRSDTNLRATGLGMPFQYEHVATATDDEGRLAALPWGLDFSAAASSADHPIYRRVSMSTLPRRGGNLTLRIYRHDKPLTVLPIAEFHLRNPYQNHASSWVPNELPATKRIGELEVELSKLRTALPHPKSRPDAAGLDTHGIWSQAMLTLRSNGSPNEDWEPESFTVSEETGNSWNGEVQSERRGPGQYLITLPGNLWDEPAWKLHLKFARIRNFAPGESCVLRAPLPPKGYAWEAQRPGTVRKMHVQLVAALGKGQPWKSDAVSTMYYARMEWPHVVVRITGAGERDRLRLTGVSTYGFRWHGNTEGHALEGNEHIYVLPSGTPPGPLRLTFAVHATCEATFLARPEQPADRR